MPPLHRLLALITVLFAPAALAQDCVGPLTLATQAEVDAFSYSEVAGSLTISGGDITNLDGISGLRSVSGAFVIGGNTLLTSLAGLEDLQSVGEYLAIDTNVALEILSGLRGSKP